MRSPAFFPAILLIISISIFISFRPKVKEAKNDAAVRLTNTELLHTIYPKTFARDVTRVDKLSQDGKMIGYIKEGALWLFDPIVLTSEKLDQGDQMDWITRFEWPGNSRAVKVTGFSESGEISLLITLDDSPDPELPQAYQDVALLDNHIYAFKYWDREKDRGGVYLQTADTGDPELILPDIYPIAMCLSPDGNSLAYLYEKPETKLTLARFTFHDKQVIEILDHLDGSERSRLGFTSNGQYLLISLAGAQKVDLPSKHEPFADRDFDIHAIDIISGEVMPVTTEEGDDMLIAVDGDRAYWNIVKPLVKSVLVSYEEGTITPLIPEQSFMPSWHPGGKGIALVYGDWRMVDFPLNWDIGKIDINKKGEVTGRLTPLVSGYHEDFGPSWSPDGGSIVYQSHRSKAPVMYYNSEGSTDDVYLRPATGSEEIRLTDFCHEAWKPEFSPDGRKVIFCASEKEPFLMKPWIIYLDEQGKKDKVREMQVDEIRGQIWNAVWSPDGRRIALEVSEGFSKKSIWMVDEDGADASLLINFECLAIVSGIDFTPDGKEVVYSSLDKNGRHQLFKVSAGGGTPEKITSNPYDIIFPEVSPDGKKIAATVYRNTKQIWSADIEI